MTCLRLTLPSTPGTPSGAPLCVSAAALEACSRACSARQLLIYFLLDPPLQEARWLREVPYKVTLHTQHLLMLCRFVAAARQRSASGVSRHAPGKLRQAGAWGGLCSTTLLKAVAQSFVPLPVL